MRLLNFTIIKLTICLILGILIGHAFEISLGLVFFIILPLLVVLFIAFLISRKQFIKTIWFGFIAYSTLIAIGILTINLHNEKNVPNHYIHYLAPKRDSLKTVAFRIREPLKPSNYYDKYVIDILKINNQNVTGKSLLNIKKDTVETTFNVDDTFITKAIFKEVNAPLNPNQFDYKSYLERKNIYSQLFISNTALLKTDSKTHTLFGITDGIRTYINSKLKFFTFKPEELSIINALLLGQRQNIDEDVYNNYIDAGAIHILAVSGLHVGIVLLLLNIILRPIEQIKNGKIIKTILLILLLWCFALIAGLSASVTRAVTMFSVLAIALNLKRPTNIYNTLAISMFIILLFKPLFLFDVGFQLSYFAVFAIVAIDPLLYRLWKPKWKIIDIYWHTLTVTLSAQLGIFPISLFYFHQFPGLFFVSNLVIIPFLSIILGFGILIIVLAVTNLLPIFLANFYSGIIDLMNDFVRWVSQQEPFLFKDIGFSVAYVIATYLLIITGAKLLKIRTYYNLKFFLIAILLFQSAMVFTAFNSPSHQFVVFHKIGFTVIGNATNDNLLMAHDFDSLTEVNAKIIRDYKIANHIKTIEIDSLQSVYLLNGTKLLVIDSLGIYNVKSFQPDYVLLRQSPKINLNRLIDSIKPKYIIADGSNYSSYVDSWESICKKRKLPFHQTSKKGAFIINY